MAESFAAVLVPAPLRSGEYEAAVFDRAGALQNMPMRFAGLPGKGRRDGEERGAGFGKRAIERREAQIVTDGEAESAPRQVGDDRQFAGPVIVGFAVTLAAGEIDIEHVDLVVACDHVALAVDQE